MNRAVEPIIIKDGFVPNVNIGDPIIYENANGEKREAVCMGVLRDEEIKTYLIKTDVTNAESNWEPLNMPIDKVWRVIGGENPIGDQMEDIMKKFKSYMDSPKKKD